MKASWRDALLPFALASASSIAGWWLGAQPSETVRWWEGESAAGLDSMILDGALFAFGAAMLVSSVANLLLPRLRVRTLLVSALVTLGPGLMLLASIGAAIRDLFHKT